MLETHLNTVWSLHTMGLVEQIQYTLTKYV